MSIRFSLAMGALCDPIEEQLQRQGLTLGDYAQRVGRWAAEISDLRIHGLLTEAESDRARNRLMKELKAAVKPVSGGEVQP